MTLYHGSYLEVKSPIAKFGRERLDFGHGFYLTKIKRQAADWAQTVAGRNPDWQPVLNVYSYDEALMRKLEARYKLFARYDGDWLDYVVACRKGNSIFKQYDVVEGGVANDQVIDTVENYEKGVITAEEALGQLTYKKINHQICILSQNIIDQCLGFKMSETLVKEDL